MDHGKLAKEYLSSNQIPIGIVVVDDDVFIREIWEKELEQEGVVSFASAEHFIEAIERGSLELDAIKCVVTDYHLGPMLKNGEDLVKELRSRRTDLPVILASDVMPPPQLRAKFDLILDKRCFDKMLLAAFI